MNRLTLSFALICTLFAAPSFADHGCSVRDIAGRWIFATGVGRQMLGDGFPADKDITAIGTMNIHRDGTLEGTFDVTVEDTVFIPGLYYTGSVVVNPDCTGTISFATSAGSVRMDSIAIVNRREVLAMSQDPFNLWTYQIRRTPADRRFGRRDDD